MEDEVVMGGGFPESWIWTSGRLVAGVPVGYDPMVRRPIRRSGA
jgi:hypothetical protein